MNEEIKQAIANQALRMIEGDDTVQDVINDALIKAFEQNSINTFTDEGFDALNDIATRFTLIYN